MCTYVYVWLCLYVCFPVQNSSFPKNSLEPVPGGPVVASVPKCHEFATLKGVEALRILAGNLPILTSQRHLQIMHFFVPLVRLEENFSSPNWNSQGSLDSDIVIFIYDYIWQYLHSDVIRIYIYEYLWYRAPLPPALSLDAFHVATCFCFRETQACWSDSLGIDLAIDWSRQVTFSRTNYSKTWLKWNKDWVWFNHIVILVQMCQGN